MWAIVRRYVARPYRIRIKSKPEHAVILGTFLVLGASGFMAEAYRIALADRPDFEKWSFVGYPLSMLVDGTGVELQLNGLYLTRERQHVDNTIRVEHAKPGSVSNQFYKGVLDGEARAVFAGKIVVRRDAQKTNAYQANDNLLLSSEAEIDTKPELEIFADDVKCSHGATAGEIDERELFYLRTRGLDPDTARSMLTFAFADEVVQRFGNAAVAAQARRELVRRLPGGERLGELA